MEEMRGGGIEREREAARGKGGRETSREVGQQQGPMEANYESSRTSQ